MLEVTQQVGSQQGLDARSRDSHFSLFPLIGENRVPGSLGLLNTRHLFVSEYP